MRYWIEVRNTSDELIARLENAYAINYVAKINASHFLAFSLPAWDDKIAYITLANEYWLIEDDEAGTQTTKRKFKLQNYKKIREGSDINVRAECLDYLSQLSTARIIDYDAGVVMTVVDTSTDGPNYFYNCRLCQDDDYVYTGDNTNGVKKIRKSDMATVATYATGCVGLCIHGDYIYTALATRKVKKLNKSDLSETGVESPDYDATATGIQAIATDGTHLFIGGWKAGGTVALKKYLCADLSYVAASANYGYILYSLILEGNYLYGGVLSSDAGAQPSYVKRWAKSDLSVITSANYANDQSISVAVDNDWVYCVGAGTGKIFRLGLTDLAKDSESSAFTASVMCLVEAGEYLYIGSGGVGTRHLVRISKSDLAQSDTATIADTNNVIIDELANYAYCGYEANFNKVSIFENLSDVIDDLLALDMQLPAVTKGTISTTYSTRIPRIKGANQTILGLLLELVDAYGGYIEVDNTRKLNWSTTIGEDKGQQIRYGKNLAGIESEIDYGMLYNRIYAYGYNPVTGIRISLTGIQTNAYVEDATSQFDWGGIYVGMFINFSMVDVAIVLEWANELLSQYKDPLISYSIDSMNLAPLPDFSFESLQLGSTITVIDEALGIDVSVQVVSIEYPDLLNPVNMKVELANSVQDLANKIVSLSSVQERHSFIIAG